MVNESYVASIIAASTLTLGVNGPQHNVKVEANVNADVKCKQTIIFMCATFHTTLPLSICPISSKIYQGIKIRKALFTTDSIVLFHKILFESIVL